MYLCILLIKITNFDQYVQYILYYRMNYTGRANPLPVPPPPDFFNLFNSFFNAFNCCCWIAGLAATAFVISLHLLAKPNELFVSAIL